MQLYEWKFLIVYHHLAKSGVHRHLVEKTWCFSLSRDLLRICNQRVMQVYVCGLHIVYHHPAKFGVHSHYDNEDTMISVCHVISVDNIIKESCVL